MTAPGLGAGPVGAPAGDTYGQPQLGAGELGAGELGVGDGALAAVTTQPWYRGQIRQVERFPGTAAVFAEPAAALPTALADHLGKMGVRLYRHQAQAIDVWRSGADVLLATRTSSGKSLAFNACMAEELLADPAATALYLYPTKALARDQLAVLQALDGELGLAAEPAVYDGDTPSAARSRIRSRSRLICSNPYGLHEYLPQAHAFGRFLAGLRLVVVDEAHRYRGVFGAHVALVLRRLTRLAERQGGRPRFVLASGTVANPAEHGAALVGRPVVVVDTDGAAHGPRTIVCYDATVDPARSMAVQTAGVVAALVQAGCRTLCFTGSRTMAELVARWAAELAPAARVSPYRAGYRPAERRDIEDRLRRGELDAVVSTDALELGVDIGGVDAAVLAGYPGTVASTWQRFGRAGRSGRPGLGILITGDDPIDAFIARRPATITGAPVERAVVASANPVVLAGQVLCAAAEAPLRPDDEPRFGPLLPDVLAGLRAEGLVTRMGTGDGFTGTFRPASLVRIDGRSDDAVSLEVDGTVVEVLEPWRAMRQAHPGAVLLHRGVALRVTDLDLERGVASAVPDSGREHTRASVVRQHRVGDPERTIPAGSWLLSLGPAQIHSQVTGFKRMRGDDVLSSQPLDLPVVTLDTRALWLEPDGGLEAVVAMVAGRGETLAAMHAAEHALIHALALLAMADRQDTGGASTLCDPSTGGPLVLLYDGLSGGSGVVDAAAAHLDQLAALAIDMVASCDCDTGCPRCVYDRDCGSGNADLDRHGALAVLGSLRGSADVSGPGGGRA